MSAERATCTNNESHFTFLSEFEDRPKGLAEAEAVVFGGVFLLSLLSNIVMLFLVGSRRWGSHTDLLLANLCVSQLLFAVTMPSVVVARVTQEWILGSFVCKMTTYLAFVCSTTLLLTLTLISMDRYLCVCKGGRLRLSKRATALIVALTWISSLGFCAPVATFQTIVSMNVKDDSYDDCTNSNGGNTPRSATECSKLCRSRTYCGLSHPEDFHILAYLVCMVTLVFIIPTVLLSIFYMKIYKIVKKASDDIRSHRIQPGQNSGENQENIHSNSSAQSSRMCFFSVCSKIFPPGSPKHQVTLVRMSLALVLSFLLLWSPFLVLACMAPASSSVSSTVFTWSLLLAYASTCVNPVLYMAFQPTGRERLVQALLRLPCCRRGDASESSARSTSRTPRRPTLERY